jgi:hypothetical protein
MAFAQPSRRRLHRVHDGDHGAPSGGPLKVPVLQRKSCQGSGVCALWGQRCAPLPFCLHRKEILPRRGAFARHHGGRLPGSKTDDMAPSGGPPKPPFCRGKADWSGAHPFGVRNGLVCLFADGRRTAATGARPSPSDQRRRALRKTPRAPAAGVSHRRIAVPSPTPQKILTLQGKWLLSISATVAAMAAGNDSARGGGSRAAGPFYAG